MSAADTPTFPVDGGVMTTYTYRFQEVTHPVTRGDDAAYAALEELYRQEFGA